MLDYAAAQFGISISTWAERKVTDDPGPICANCGSQDRFHLSVSDNASCLRDFWPNQETGNVESHVS